MVYLLIGTDSRLKEERIERLKKTILTSTDARQFDYEHLSCHRLSKDILKQSLDALPAIGEKRLVLLREIEKLDKHNKELLVSCLEQKQEHVVVVLEAQKLDGKTVFYKKLKVLSKMEHFDLGYRENAFDMTKAISAREPVRAIKVLNQVLDHGDHPLQVLGALIWFWGKHKSRIHLEAFQQGLQELQKADINIKRSRLKPEHTLEILVIKLCSLAS